ncbi:hypothetical protein, partial [Nocardioides sp. P5_C9_2]
SYDAYRSGRLDTRPGTTAAATARRTFRVTSDNGYLSVTRDEDGGLLGVDVDAEWLSGARSEYLEAAIMQSATGDQDGK